MATETKTGHSPVDEPVTVATRETADAQPGRGDLVDRYVLLDTLGRGGMGVVYKAYDPELNRVIALKIVPRRSGADATALLGEARALARLSHPNVVPVYDAGRVGDSVYIAMELVDGGDLRAALSDGPLDARRAVEVFVAAGRGLAAAHAADLVHRDFKPENVIVGADGRIRVVDFGIATTRTDGGGSGAGTPRYMSPEQRAGRVVDARSDQYSFCLALGEAVTGVTDTGEMVRRVEPGWLRAVVERGLAERPSDRYESMNQLVTELARDRAGRRRAIVLGAAAVALVAVAATGWWFAVRSSDRVDVCASAGERWGESWNGERRAAVVAGIEATGVAGASDIAIRVSSALDEYGAVWTAAREDACRATNDRGEQSPELLDRRMECLDDRLRDVVALVDALQAADANLVYGAVEAVGALRGPGPCADTEALLARVAMPESAADREVVAAERDRLAAARVRARAGDYAGAMEVDADVAARARALGYRPLEAEALLMLGDHLERADQLERAESELAEAFGIALSIGHDSVAAGAAAELGWVVGVRREDDAGGMQWMHIAEAAAARAGDDVEVAARVALMIANVHDQHGRIEEAVAAARRSVELHEAAYGRDHVATAVALHNLGRELSINGDHDEAIAVLERALVIKRAEHGDVHPNVAMTLGALGGVWKRRGDLAKAEDYVRQQVDMLIATRGEDNSDTTDALGFLGVIVMNAKRFEDADAIFTRALDLSRQVMGEASVNVVDALLHLGLSMFEQKRFRESLAYHEQALDAARAHYGPGHLEIANVHMKIGLVYDELGDLAAGLTHKTRGLEIREATLKGTDPRIWSARIEVGWSLVTSSRFAEGRLVLERFTRGEMVGATAIQAGELVFWHAVSVWESLPADRAKAVELARRARAIYADIEDDIGIREVDAWLAEHPSPAAGR